MTTDHEEVNLLVVQCHNSIYTTTMAIILYYHKFGESLELEGHSLNPYDPCVTNKIINNKRMKIFFHVDDCKLIHKSPKVVVKTIDWIIQEYKSIFKDGYGAMSVIRGKIHKYLGMNLDYTVS